MKLKTKPEKALFCPKHGRQMYYTTSVGKKPVQWCSQQLSRKERRGEGNNPGSPIAYVSKSGKVLTTDWWGWHKVKFKAAKTIYYAECYERLRERLVHPKKERLLGRIWNLDWSSGIWRCETDRALAVSGRVKKGGPNPWRYYAPQFNTPEINKKTKWKSNCWLYGGRTRLAAMKKAIRNLETLRAAKGRK